MRHFLIFATLLSHVAGQLPLERIFGNLKIQNDRDLCVGVSLKEYLNLFLSVLISDCESAERDFILLPDRLSEGKPGTDSFPPYAHITATTSVDKNSFFAKETTILNERIAKAKELIRSVYGTVDPLARAKLILKLMMNRVYNERTVFASFLWNQVFRANYGYDSTLASYRKFLSALRTQMGVNLKEDLQHEFEKVKVVISLSKTPMSDKDIKSLTSDFESMSIRILDSVNKKKFAAEQQADDYVPEVKAFYWIQNHCHYPNPSNPQLNEILKRVAGKIIAKNAAGLDEQTRRETMRALAYIIPAFHVGSVPATYGIKIPGLPKINIPYTRKLKTQGFSQNDVSSKQSLTIPSDADVDFVVSEMLAGDQLCNRSCVDRFTNWAVDELKKGTTTNEFIIAVRNKLRGS